METVADIKFLTNEIAALNSVMPGGGNWHTFVSSEGDCLKSCPYYPRCKGNGPDYVCSDDWLKSEANPEVLAVAFHVVSHFEYYNKSDLRLNEDSKTVLGIGQKLLEALEAQRDGEFDEGNPNFRMHRFLERDSKEARQVKAEALSKGELRCAACQVDYFPLFGIKATRVVECHHTVPLSSKNHSGKTLRKSLILLCANCHRLAHSEPEPIPILKLRRLVQRT